MYGPRLVGKRVTLGPPPAGFNESARRWFSDLEVTRYLMTRMTFSEQQEDEFLKAMATSEHCVFWAILVEERPIGSLSIDSIKWIDRSGVTGTVIGERECWRHGYASEAIALRTAFAFEQLGLETLTTVVAQPNSASRRALERAGYRTAGTFRRHAYVDGAFVDAWLGELLREEWITERDKAVAGESTN